MSEHQANPLVVPGMVLDIRSPIAFGTASMILSENIDRVLTVKAIFDLSDSVERSRVFHAGTELRGRHSGLVALRLGEVGGQAPKPLGGAPQGRA